MEGAHTHTDMDKPIELEPIAINIKRIGSASCNVNAASKYLMNVWQQGRIRLTAEEVNELEDNLNRLEACKDLLIEVVRKFRPMIAQKEVVEASQK